MIRINVDIRDELVKDATSGLDHAEAEFGGDSGGICDSSDFVQLSFIDESDRLHALGHLAFEKDSSSSIGLSTSGQDGQIESFESEMLEEWQSRSSEEINRDICVAICDSGEDDMDRSLAEWSQ